MGIEEINRDRQAFMGKVNEAVSVELEKIGLALVNVNIRDIEDESGYIEALGRKAAAEAVNQAMVDVADQERYGKIGVAERDRDRRQAVANANSQAAVGEAEAERDRRKAVAAAESLASIGEAEADRNRRQKIAMLDATAVETEAQANSQKASYMAGQKVAEEEARSRSATAGMKADGEIRVAEQEAQRLAEEARATREQARLKAEIVVPAEAAKEKAIVDAEAERQQYVLVADGEAKATKIRMEAEGHGQKAILDGKAAGYKALVDACASDSSLAASFLIIEKLLEVSKIQSEAIQNLPLDKVVVWDGGSDGGGVSDLGRRIMGVLPPMHELAKVAGLELPEYLGKATGENDGKEAKPAEPKPEE
jgi:flotillin